MKIITTLLVAIVGLAAAHPTSPNFVKRVGESCDITGLSCQLSDDTVDFCCSPQHGLVALSLQWAPGFGPKDAFTIHGLWPDNCNGTWLPEDGCNFSEHYSQDDIGSLVANAGLSERMNKFWPSNKGENNNHYFWWHEWDRHGTCVSTLGRRCDSSYKDGSGNNYIEYINTVLDLRDQYDIYGALSANGIIPSDTKRYDTKKIKDAITKKFTGAVAKLDCENSTLTDVTINFNVQGRDTYVLNSDGVYLNSHGRPDYGSCRGQIKLPLKYH